MPATPLFTLDEGIPFLRNYTLSEYNLQPQNWCILQDPRGIIYIGNHGGLLEYDGSQWRIIDIPNWSVRSMEFDAEGNLIIGGKDSIGIIRFPLRRKPEFASVTEQLPPEERHFGNIWRMIRSGHHLYLWSSGFIFRWDGRTLDTWKKGLPCRGIYRCRDDAFIHLRNRGLEKIERGKIIDVPGGDIFSENKIRAILPHGEAELLVLTEKSGLFVSKKGSFHRFNTDADSLFDTHVPYCGIRLQDESYCIGTSRGIIILDNRGGLTGLYNKKSGLQDEDILALFEDRGNNIWMGLSVGIARIEYGSPFRVMDHRLGLSGMALSLFQTQDGIVAGTSSGIFRLWEHAFVPIKGAEGYCRDIAESGGKRFAATSNGILIIHGDGAVKLSERGTYDFCISKKSPGVVWGGTADGIMRLNAESNPVKVNPIPGFRGEVRTLVEDGEGTLWAGTTTRGVFRLAMDPEGGIVQREHYFIDDGLPGKETHVYTISGKVVFATYKGLYRFDPVSRRFLPDSILGEQFSDGSTGVFLIHEDKEGNVWFHAGNRNYLAEKEPSGGYALIHQVFRRMPQRQVNDILRMGNHVYFATVEGIIRFDYERKQGPGNAVPPLLRKLVINGIHAEYHGSPSETSIPESAFTFSPESRNIRFEFALPFYEFEEKSEFRCKLEGSGRDVSKWIPKTAAEFYNLTYGYYQFNVEAKNAYGEITASTRFPFRIRAPWYWQWWAFPIYLILFSGFVLLIVRWRSAALVREKRELEKTVNLRTRELREKSGKLEEMDRIKSRFFANISHEFRTPLTLINGPLEDMIQKSGDPEKIPILKNILRNSQRLLRLINQLLDLAKLESGKLKLNHRRGDLVAFTKGITSSFAHRAERKEVELSLDSSEDRILVAFDPQKMEQVLVNLIANALKFTDPGGGITVHIGESSEEKSFVNIDVMDTGNGIPDCDKDKVFDRFYQSGAYSEGGTGIGLSLARELVRLHGGEITVESNHPRGTIFHIRLPVLQSGGDEAIKIPGQEEDIHVVGDHAFCESVDNTARSLDDGKESEDRKTILVIDDLADIREYIHGILFPEFTVIEAEDGESGIREARDSIPDLIICDVMMPGLNGFEVCKTLKGDIKTSHIPVIMLTAKAGEADQIEGLRKGADDYIVKPFSSGILLSRIRNLITLRRELQLKITRELSMQPAEIQVTSMDQEFLKEFKAVVEKHISDPLLDIERLTEKMMMGRTTLFRKIEGLTGLTPMQFVRSFRLQRGAQLLKQGFGTVSQVSMEVGFTSPAYFTKCFREKFGRLPSEFAVTEKE